MLSNVLLKTVRDQRRSFMWWSVGIVLVNFITVLFYPSLSAATEFNEILGDDNSLMRAFVGDIADLTSPEGFLNSQLFFLLVPLLFIVFTAAQSTSAIAGEEEKGTLDILLSHPVPRWRVVAEKFAAMFATLFALALLAWLAIAAGALVVDMEISYARMLAVTVSAALLGLAFGSLGLALGSATGNRGLSIGVTGALAVTAYLLNALAPLVETLEPLQRVSPFYLYIGADPLSNGLDPVHAATLAALSAVLLATAALTFERRDIAV